MKKKISSIVLTCILLLSAKALVTAQTYDCRPASASAVLYGNNVRATIRNGGDMFWDGTRARFVVPATGVNGVEVSTIFAGGLWLSARDTSNQLKAATCTYRNRGNDFYPGPINMVTRETDRGQCNDWDKIFSVSSCEVTRMVDDFNDNGTLDITPAPSVLTWPGRGNPHFDSLMGFQLPNQSLAPFFDRNRDSIYNPYDGDYPSIIVNRRTVIPAQLMWFVYNDIGNIHGETRGLPIGVQVGVSCYAFSDSLLDNNIFVRYEVTNYSSGRLDSLRLGVFQDPDLGCEANDMVGFHRLTNTSYVYSRDSVDFLIGCSAPGFGGNPPVQATTFVDKQTSSFNYYFRADLAPYPGMGDPTTPEGYSNLLAGLWPDGTLLYTTGNGYRQTGTTTNFAFEGNPFTQTSLYSNAADIRILQSTFHPSLALDSTFSVDVMYSYHRGDSVRSSRPNLDNVTLMMTEVPQMLQHYQNGNVSSAPCPAEVVWPGDTDINGIVDARDFLNPAVATGVSATGLARQRVFSGWNGEAATADWGSFGTNLHNNVNLKYADCDGDGVAGDNASVIGNFGKSYREVDNDYGTQGLGLRMQRSFDRFFPASDSIVRIGYSGSSGLISNNVKYEIHLDSTPDLYGLAFEVEYDPTMVSVRTSNRTTVNVTSPNQNSLGQNGTGWAIDKPGDWSYYGSNLINIRRFGSVHYAVYQTDGTAEPLSSGAAGSLVFRLAIQRPFNDTAAVDSLFFRFKNIRGVRADGSIIALGSQDGVLVFSERPPVGIDTEPSMATFELTPNPSDGQIRLETDGRDAGTAYVSVCNMLGQEVHRQTLDGSSTSLSLQHLPQGVYLVNILGGEVRYAPQKVVIHR